jgi:hypothetical protein
MERSVLRRTAPYLAPAPFFQVEFMLETAAMWIIVV